MKPADALALLLPPVSDLKRRSMIRTDGEHTMFPTVVAVRDGRVVVAVSTPRMAVTLSCASTMGVGYAPDLLALAAQVTRPDGSEGIGYTMMSREMEGSFALQPYVVRERGLEFHTPEPGTPEDRSLLDELARAMTAEPMDVGRVSPRGPSQAQTNPPMLPRELGRLVVDAGTTRTLQDRVAGVGGRALYVAASPEQATSLIGYGMPEASLLS